MKIDLTNLEEPGSFKEIKAEIKFENLNYNNRKLETEEPFLLDVVFYNTGDSFSISGNLEGELILECSRCLEEFSYLMDIDIEKELPKKDLGDLKHVEIDDILEDEIYLSIPMKPLCKSDCKGLCPECGQNLNEADCDCDTEIVDPRLAKLKDFFNDEDE